MEKLKDFIYEHSDLFFTALIVAVVGVIVASNLYGWFDIKDKENKYKEINEIIHEEQEDIVSKKTDSSEKAKEDSSKKTEDASKSEDAKKDSDKNSTSDKKEPSKETVKETPKEPESKPVIRNVDIAPGSSSSSIAKALEKQGLVKSASDFLNVLTASGKETKLKAGTFAIPEGSTDEKIIEILTK